VFCLVGQIAAAVTNIELKNSVIFTYIDKTKNS